MPGSSATGSGNKLLLNGQKSINIFAPDRHKDQAAVVKFLFTI
jgi:hypothetical protein